MPVKEASLTHINIAPDLIHETHEDQISKEVNARREEVLRNLLDGPYLTESGSQNPGNYEYARDSRLLDQFYYDPEKGRDAIVHILSGDVKKDIENGDLIVGGFHHEPSGDSQNTYVDYEAMQSSSKKKSYRQYSFEPYKARTVIGKHVSQELVQDDEGSYQLSKIGSTMFPKEYDALAVLRTIANARDEALKNGELKTGESGALIADTDAPLLDGKSKMKLRIVMDPVTHKIITAHPRSVNGNGIMKLSQVEVDRNLGLID